MKEIKENRFMFISLLVAICFMFGPVWGAPGAFPVDVSLPENTTYSSLTVPFIVRGNGSISTWIYTLDGTNTTFTANGSLVSTTTGSHTVIFWGNISDVWNSTEVNYTISIGVLQSITDMIGELPGLLDAVADSIPAIVRIVLMIGVALLVLGIFGEIVKLISNMGLKDLKIK